MENESLTILIGSEIKDGNVGLYLDIRLTNTLIQEELVIWQMAAERHLNSSRPIIRHCKDSGSAIICWLGIW